MEVPASHVSTETPDKENVMTRKTAEQPIAPTPENAAFFSKEELQALRETIKKSRTRVSETKAQSCAYHR
ncbi:hypothetical protein DLD99_13400 [Pseudomonas kribbensis]|uniref:Uncharacterized protein n=2 Tax=Pseudomonas kribbensis TaxID=1628086 RepID=A0A345RQ57_9PSED|nr:hypothetical protein DLD99_13400 [Pseudomonas kribbensis]